ncbi:MFS transporter [Chrysiogenes arsenatis]|uniref:MFS transporter n=1 Tax=Chrysiogenes arsenatis TaxID=309797 RepID=UPI00135F1920
MTDFHIGAAVLGNLSATYFYTYAIMQIPSGLLADTIGPRRLATGAAFLAAIGICIFAFAPNLWMAYIGRGLVGASVAVAFVACMKLAGHWFPTNRFATVTGVALLLGNIGGILAGVPLSEAVATFGWRVAMMVSGVVTLVGAILIWTIVRDDPSERGYASYDHVKATKQANIAPRQALRLVASEPATWWLFAAAGLSAAPVLVFAGLWGVPYLTQIYGMERSQAAMFTSTMLLAWAAGGPAFGALSDYIGRRKAPYLIANILAACFWGIFLFVDVPQGLLYPLFAAIGFTSGGLIVGFAYSREVNHPAVSGTVGGVVNMSVLGVAALLQPLLGSVLDYYWDGTVLAGVPIYSADAYFTAFAILLGCVVASAFMLTPVKESYCTMRSN